VRAGLRTLRVDMIEGVRREEGLGRTARAVVFLLSQLSEDRISHSGVGHWSTVPTRSWLQCQLTPVSPRRANTLNWMPGRRYVPARCPRRQLQPHQQVGCWKHGGLWIQGHNGLPDLDVL